MGNHDFHCFWWARVFLDGLPVAGPGGQDPRQMRGAAFGVSGGVGDLRQRRVKFGRVGGQA